MIQNRILNLNIPRKIEGVLQILLTDQGKIDAETDQGQKKGITRKGRGQGIETGGKDPGQRTNIIGTGQDRKKLKKDVKEVDLENDQKEETKDHLLLHEKAQRITGQVPNLQARSVMKNVPKSCVK